MEARLDALPVEERSEAALSMAHARTHFATLLANSAGSMEARERALALDEIEALQARAVAIEDAWVYDAFGRIWRGLADNDRALPLFERAIAVARANDIIIVHDNAYSEITYDGYVAPSFLATPGAKDVGIEVFSLSKTYNMTGWRSGASGHSRAPRSASRRRPPAGRWHRPRRS
jgi:tetratricopeptide (TPR) repeat protein